MSVIVRTECQKCESIEELELEGVIIIGFSKVVPGEVVYWCHELIPSQKVRLIKELTARLYEDIRELEINIKE